MCRRRCLTNKTVQTPRGRHFARAPYIPACYRQDTNISIRVILLAVSLTPNLPIYRDTSNPILLDAHTKRVLLVAQSTGLPDYDSPREDDLFLEGAAEREDLFVFGSSSAGQEKVGGCENEGHTNVRSTPPSTCPRLHRQLIPLTVSKWQRELHITGCTR